MHRTKIKIGWKPKMKTKEVVWGAIWTATKSEKTFWGVEIEIYRLVMSEGSQGTGKISKWSICFWVSGPVCQLIIVDPQFFWVLVLVRALKVKISLSQISFRSKFDQKSLLGFFNFVKHFESISKKLRFAEINKFEICKKIICDSR